MTVYRGKKGKKVYEKGVSLGFWDEYNYARFSVLTGMAKKGIRTIELVPLDETNQEESDRIRGRRNGSKR